MSSARRYAIGFFLTIFAVAHFLNMSAQRSVEGVVKDYWDPVPGVTVGWQGERARAKTDDRGQFRLPKTDRSRRLIATKPGFRIGLLRDAKSPFFLKLEPLPEFDNESYQWIDPHRDLSKSNNCANCHGEIYREWLGSAHARAATNPKFLSLYAGRDDESTERDIWKVKNVNFWGAAVCTTCHVPTFRTYLFEDLRSPQGIHKSGISCDYCHKVNDVPTGKFGTRFGRDALKLLRPPDDELLTFGPLDDAVRKGESFAHRPIYKRSEYCASCHEGVVFGVHAYGTYSEWLESPARRDGKQCQSCHMAPTGLMTNIAPGKGGIERNPFTLASHHTPGGQIEISGKAVSLNMNVKNDARPAG